MQEEEINLRDYINVISKRKGTILTLFFLSVIITTVICYAMPRIYRISMVFERGSLGVREGGETLYSDSSTNIKAKIESGAFNSKIIKALNLRPERPLKFRVYSPRDSEILKVSIERKEEGIEDGIRILDQLLDELSNSYDQVEFIKNSIEKEISAISNDITAKNNEIRLREEMLRMLEERESELINETKELKSGKALAKEDVILLNYLNQLREQSVNLRVEKGEIEISIKNLQSEIEKLQVDIESLNLGKDRIHNMRLVQEPEVSSNPIKPKKRQNIALSAILGLMLGIFIAFFQEYAEKTGNISSQESPKVD